MIGTGTLLLVLAAAWLCARATAKRVPERPLRNVEFSAPDTVSGGQAVLIAVDGRPAPWALARSAMDAPWLLLDAQPPHRPVCRERWDALEDAQRAVRGALERRPADRPRRRTGIGRTVVRGLVLAGDVRAASLGMDVLGKRLARRAVWRTLVRL